MEENEALLKGFIDESREHLTTIEADLLVIEEGGENIDEELVNKVFRAAHSIKGGSGFFGLQKVKELAHKAETVLDMLRSRRMQPNAEVTNILLAAFDQLREMINHTDISEDADIADLLANLAGLASAYQHGPLKNSLAEQANTEPVVAGSWQALSQDELERARKTRHFIYQVDCDLIRDVEKKGRSLDDFFAALETTSELLEVNVDTAEVGDLESYTGATLPVKFVIATVLEPDLIDGLFAGIDRERIKLVFDPSKVSSSPGQGSTPAPIAEHILVPPAGAISASEPVHVPPVQKHPARSGAKPQTAAAVEDTLRVDVGLLETLMNLAGELVLSRNQLRAAVAQNNGIMLASADQRINQVTSELQDVIMQTRLQPINNVFAKFPRVVRDLSRTLGKEIELEVLGKDVALDKTLIEGLSDPLTHMVRNAVDHGIESAQERARAGKKAAGSIRIEARHEAGQVVLEISDDGKGIDPDRIAEAALGKGLISLENWRECPCPTNKPWFSFQGYRLPRRCRMFPAVA